MKHYVASLKEDTKSWHQVLPSEWKWSQAIQVLLLYLLYHQMWFVIKLV